MLERTLCLIKPDAIAKNALGAITAMIEEQKLRVVAIKTLRLSRSQAEGFYAVHHGKPFFEGLIEFMISGPLAALVLEGDDAVARYRGLMGPTDSTKAPGGTIRQRFGTDTRYNAVHGSDSPQNALVEIAYFFSPNELNALS